MATHVFMRDIKDRILAALPVWRNVKRAQKLDEYIKEKKVEKKKINERTFTLNDEIVLTSLQEKVVVV